MSDWTCVEYNPVSGVSTWIKIEGDKTLVQERQDVSKLLDDNTAQRNVTSPGWKGDYHSLARLPLAMLHAKGGLLHDAMKAGDDERVKRFLNDSDNSRLRTKEGRV
jgi:hypothetical protein